MVLGQTYFQKHCPSSNEHLLVFGFCRNTCQDGLGQLCGKNSSSNWHLLILGACQHDLCHFGSIKSAKKKRGAMPKYTQRIFRKYIPYLKVELCTNHHGVDHTVSAIGLVPNIIVLKSCLLRKVPVYILSGTFGGRWQPCKRLSLPFLSLLL